MDRKLKLLFYETFTSKCLYPHVRLIACRVRLFATLWTVAQQAPLSLGFSRQEYWSGLPALLQGISPTQESNPGLPHCRQILNWVTREAKEYWSG